MIKGRGKMKDYKDLKVWLKAFNVALNVMKTMDRVSRKSDVIKIIMGQVIRSSTSVCANIAEGYGSDTNREFAHYLGIAFKSALETDNWIQVLKGYIKKETDKFSEIEQQNLESIKMLISLKKKVGKSARERRFESKNN